MKEIVIVSGLPRSGTSMMMRMLEAGGVPLLVDGVRAADEDNPRGYWEWEPVKQLPAGEAGWLEEARGRAVKIVSPLLVHLPPTYRYRVLFMQRHLSEVLASQRRMLARRGEAAGIDDAEMAAYFQAHLRKVEAWLQAQPHISLLMLSYNDLVVEPRPAIAQVVDFLTPLGVDGAAMARVVEPELYRNR